MLDKVFAFWRGHGTKIIGFAQGTIAALAGVTGVIPDSQLKYWLGVSAVLTVWRGFSNTAATPSPP
jgi:hypothetical protein